jgi:hypothetical protein
LSLGVWCRVEWCLGVWRLIEPCLGVCGCVWLCVWCIGVCVERRAVAVSSPRAACRAVSSLVWRRVLYYVSSIVDLPHDPCHTTVTLRSTQQKGVEHSHLRAGRVHLLRLTHSIACTLHCSCPLVSLWRVALCVDTVCAAGTRRSASWPSSRAPNGRRRSIARRAWWRRTAACCSR